MFPLYSMFLIKKLCKCCYLYHSQYVVNLTLNRVPLLWIFFFFCLYHHCVIRMLFIHSSFLQVWALSEQNISNRLFEKDSLVRQSQVCVPFNFHNGLSSDKFHERFRSSWLCFFLLQVIYIWQVLLPLKDN